MLLKEKLVHMESRVLACRAEDFKGFKLLTARVDGYSMRELRLAVDELRDTLKSCIIVLGVADGSKVNLIAAVSKDLTSKIKAGALVSAVAAKVGGKGGGRPDIAQAGGSEPEHLDDALTYVKEYLGGVF